MKKLTATLLILLTLTFSISAAKLNPSAQVIKDNMPAGYIVMKSLAALQFPADPDMQLYELNKQSESAFNMFLLAGDFSNLDVDIFFSALDKWSLDDSQQANFDVMVVWFNKIVINNTSVIHTFFELPVDWNMLEYEYNKQMEAKGLLE